MHQANSVFLTTLFLVAIGFALKKLDFITEKEGKTISKFLMHTTFPALLLVSTIRIKLEPQLFLIPLITFIYGIVMLTIAWFVFKKNPNQIRGLLTMASSGFNSGLFAFPIIEGIWGRDALMYAIMFDIGNTFIVFGLTYTVGNYFSDKGTQAVSIKPILKKMFGLMPFQGLVLGLIINVLSIPVAPVLMDCLDTLAKGNKPIVLLLMGIYLSFNFDFNQIKNVGQSLLIRYVLGLSVVVLLYFFMPHSVMRSVLIFCAILPVGLTLLPFSDELNYDSRVAGLLVNVSFIISFALIWVLVLALGLTTF
jgi:malate permease and related proteins